LTGRTFPLRTKGRLYQACVRSVMLYGSETWPVKEEDVVRLERNDMRMIRWMCGVSLSDRHSSQALRARLGLASIRESLQSRRLRWFGHVERMGESNWVSKSRTYQVEGRNCKGRPRKTWGEVVRNDLKERNVDGALVHDRVAWKSVTRTRPTHASMENGR